MNEHSVPQANIIMVRHDYGNKWDELLFWDMAKYDARVHYVENGCDALAIIETDMPDMIISEYMMPDMNGEDLFRAVREKPELIDIPFIILVASGVPQTISEVEYVNTPFDDDLFVDMVETLLDGYISKRDDSQKENG